MGVAIQDMMKRLPPWGLGTLASLLIIGWGTLPVHGAPVPFLTGQGQDVSFRSFEDDAGGFYLAWTNQEAGKLIGLCAQHIDAKSQTQWGVAGLCITARLASAKDWNGLADGRGGLMLFWDETDGVHAQRFHPGAGERPEKGILLSTSTALQPDAVADATGGTLVVWRESLPSGRSVLLAQRMDADGQPVWPKGGIRVSLRASNQTNPRVIFDNMSGMIVAWRDEANSASELRVQRIDFQANRLWGLEGMKVTAPVGASEFPQIAPLGTGEAVLAWTGAAGGTSQIFLQKVGPDPALKWGDMTLASNIPTSYNRWNPVLLGAEDGGTWIAWEDFRNQLNYQIQLNHLHEDGRSPWPGGEIAVAPAPGDQGKIAMTHDGKEGVCASWIDNRLATIGLYIQEVDGSGNRLQGKQGTRLADQLSKPSVPQLVSLRPGRVAVIWADRPKKGQWSLFWSIVPAPGPGQ
jgi:hypothetical protein